MSPMSQIWKIKKRQSTPSHPCLAMLTRRDRRNSGQKPWVARSFDATRTDAKTAVDAARGAGTSMISLILPPKSQISQAANMLANEFGTACVTLSLTYHEYGSKPRCTGRTSSRGSTGSRSWPPSRRPSRGSSSGSVPPCLSEATADERTASRAAKRTRRLL